MSWEKTSMSNERSLESSSKLMAPFLSDRNEFPLANRAGAHDLDLAVADPFPKRFLLAPPALEAPDDLAVVELDLGRLEAESSEQLRDVRRREITVAEVGAPTEHPHLRFVGFEHRADSRAWFQRHSLSP